MQSVLTKKQTKQFGPRPCSGYGAGATITATVRYDDECGNGHNTFAITGEIYAPEPSSAVPDVSRPHQRHRPRREPVACGCLHEEIAKAFPELAPLIKWHLTSSDGPMHFIANTVHHVLQHGFTHAWIYYTGPADPLGIGDGKERLLTYGDVDAATKVEGVEGYRVKWDEKTAKTRNLDHARSCAVWPDATDEDLTAPGLEGRLAARLPGMLAEFKAAVESLGFTY